MSDQKIKAASGKCPLNLIPLSAVKGAARVFGYGAKKYAAGNYLTADDDEIGNRYVGGFLRHISDAQRPDGLYDLASLAALDAESGLPEIDHALCGLMMLRALLIKRGALPADPGEGHEPPAREPANAPRLHTGEYTRDGRIVITSPGPVRAGDGISVRVDLAHAPSLYPEGDPAAVRPFREGLDECPRGSVMHGNRNCPERADTGTCDHERPYPPRPTGPGETGVAPPKNDPEADAAAEALAKGAIGEGPRFVVVRAEHVPEGAAAEFFCSTRNVVERQADLYNHDEDGDRATFQPDRWPRKDRSLSAVVDTRPQEGYGK